MLSLSQIYVQALNSDDANDAFWSALCFLSNALKCFIYRHGADSSMLSSVQQQPASRFVFCRSEQTEEDVCTDYQIVPAFLVPNLLDQKIRTRDS